METNEEAESGAREISVLDGLKNDLTKILMNKVDQFEILNLAQRLSQDISYEESFSRQKYLVQKAVLEQILKSDHCDYFERLLQETNCFLKIKKTTKFLCCMVGCLFETDKHRSYLQHLKKVHSTYDELVCNFMHQCRRKFSSMRLLLDHVKSCHSSWQPPSAQSVPLVVQSVACKCNMISCSGKTFQSVEMLMSHVINFHNNQTRECIFEECSSKFAPGKPSTVRHHFSNKHKKLNKLILKKKFLIPDFVAFEDVLDDSDEDNVDEPDREPEEENLNLYTESDFAAIDENNDYHDVDDSVISETNDDNFCLMQYADFLNRLSHFKFIPYKTVTDIANEYLANSLKSQEIREKKLRASLKQIPNITEEIIENIVHDVIGDDEFLKAQKELNSEYKRVKFVKNNFKFIPPLEIILNKAAVQNGEPKDCVHYIPVTQSFQHLVEDRSLNDVLEMERENVRKTFGVFKDFTDGSAFRENLFFRKNPGAFVGHFYSDAVELSNPLGAAKGKHKINQVFYTVAQIPKEQRSKIDRMQLCMVFKDKLVKKYGYTLIYRTLIEDLKTLERGITVNFPIQRKVQLGLFIYSADNLEAHSLGGFSCCFSSRDICRFCHATYSDLQTHIHDYDAEKPHDCWTVEEYDQICNNFDIEDNDEEVDIEAIDMETDLFNYGVDETNILQQVTDEILTSDEDISDVENVNDETVSDTEEEGDSITFGLRQKCPLNQLDAFHAVLGFPPDCMHDWFEGVIAQDLLGVIKILAQKGWFSVEDYNGRLRSLGFRSHEAANKPEDVKIKGKKLSGKAVR